MFCWSKVILFQFIRSILLGEGSLWVAWVRAYVLKGGDFWLIPCTNSMSWFMKKLLKAREEAAPFFAAHSDLSKMNSKLIWDETRLCRDRVVWHKLVWFAQHVPKHAIISWLAFLNRLATRDRLMRMGVVNENCCIFCAAEESRNHLFFECVFAREVWRGVLTMCLLNRDVLDWDAEIEWAIGFMKGNSLLTFILKLSLSASIYLIWEERNRRCFTGVAHTVEDILRLIREIVKIKITYRGIHRLTQVDSSLCIAWGIV
ncbi:hypothetical protein GQ457_14G009900 [Hibiscus cannabinus]